MLVRNILKGAKRSDNLTNNEQELIYGNDSFFGQDFIPKCDRCEVLNKTRILYH